MIRRKDVTFSNSTDKEIVQNVAVISDLLINLIINDGGDLRWKKL